MNTYKVYYVTNTHYGAEHHAPSEDYTPPTLESITETYVFVKELRADSPGETYRLMQAENNPFGEDIDRSNAYLTNLGLHRTSMSVGDIIQHVEACIYYECMTFGWRELS